MNQALSFGLVFGGGVLLTSALTGSSIADVVRGHPAKVGTTGQQLSVGGVGSAIANVAQGASLAVGNLAAGFLPTGAKYTPGRKDQGRDGQTNPGGPIIAPGSGTVVRIGSDPGGFGPSYPIVHFTSGPFSGRTMYVGHVIAAVSGGQRFSAGTILGHTSKSGGIGNATTPGWFEIGYADGGSPGPFGQPAPF